MYTVYLPGRRTFVISAVICMVGLLIKSGDTHGGYGGGGYGGGFHGLGLGHLGLFGATNLSALCMLRGGTCTLPGSCITNLHRGGLGIGYGSSGYNQFLCNTTTICCLPFKVISYKKVIYPSRRRYGRKRGYSRRRSRGYGRRSSSW